MPPTATPAETVERTFKPLQQFTRGWMMADATDAYGVELGFATGRQFWVVGRAGVLGGCPWPVAAGGLAFHSPEHVKEAWEAVPSGLTHYEVAAVHYAGRVFAWGQEALTPHFEHERLEAIDSLGRRIIHAAPDSLGSVFAGWRQVPPPEEIGARVALTTHVLREMRGAAHITAVIAAGLSPLDAILASTNAPPRTGPGYAERMGFVGPFRDPEEVRAPRLAAETATAAIMEGYYSVLSPTELAHFGEVVDTTREAIDM
jgi:hypothetical protein